MSETVAMFVASLEVLAVWVFVSLFIVVYALGASWNRSVVGRTLMFRACTMFLLVTLALIGRWFPFADEAFQYLALATYGVIAIAEGRMLLILVLILRGTITPTQQNWTPVRDWIRRRRKEK